MKLKEPHASRLKLNKWCRGAFAIIGVEGSDHRCIRPTYG